jgi:hypothetical protein
MPIGLWFQLPAPVSMGRFPRPRKTASQLAARLFARRSIMEKQMAEGFLPASSPAAIDRSTLNF